MIKLTDAVMERFERYSDITILSNCFFAIRVDGRSFHTEVKRMKLKRPFDKKLRNALNKAIKIVMKDFGSVFAYTESDECTFLFLKDNQIFDRRIEKLTSLVASKMSVEFAKSSLVRDNKISPTFDARILELPSKDDVIKCFQWRQMDSHRNSISTQCFWRLVKSGMSERNAQKKMMGMKDTNKNELLFSQFGINYNDTPQWQRKGTMFFVKQINKIGYNPIKKQKETAIRNKIMCEDIKIYFKKDNLDQWINKGVKIL